MNGKEEKDVNMQSERDPDTIRDRDIEKVVFFEGNVNPVQIQAINTLTPDASLLLPEEVEEEEEQLDKKLNLHKIKEVKQTKEKQEDDDITETENKEKYHHHYQNNNHASNNDLEEFPSKVNQNEKETGEVNDRCVLNDINYTLYQAFSGEIRGSEGNEDRKKEGNDESSLELQDGEKKGIVTHLKEVGRPKFDSFYRASFHEDCEKKTIANRNTNDIFLSIFGRAKSSSDPSFNNDKSFINVNASLGTKSTENMLNGDGKTSANARIVEHMATPNESSSLNQSKSLIKFSERSVTTSLSMEELNEANYVQNQKSWKDMGNDPEGKAFPRQQGNKAKNECWNQLIDISPVSREQSMMSRSDKESIVIEGSSSTNTTYQDQTTTQATTLNSIQNNDGNNDKANQTEKKDNQQQVLQEQSRIDDDKKICKGDSKGQQDLSSAPISTSISSSPFSIPSSSFEKEIDRQVPTLVRGNTEVLTRNNNKVHYRNRLFNNIDAVFKKSKDGTKVIRLLCKYLKEIYLLEQNYSNILSSSGENFAGINESHIPFVATAIGKIFTSIMASGRYSETVAADFKSVHHRMKSFCDEDEAKSTSLIKEASQLLDKIQKERNLHSKKREKYLRLCQEGEALISKLEVSVADEKKENIRISTNGGQVGFTASSSSPNVQRIENTREDEEDSEKKIIPPKEQLKESAKDERFLTKLLSNLAIQQTTLLSTKKLCAKVKEIQKLFQRAEKDYFDSCQNMKEKENAFVESLKVCLDKFETKEIIRIKFLKEQLVTLNSINIKGNTREMQSVEGVMEYIQLIQGQGTSSYVPSPQLPGTIRTGINKAESWSRLLTSNSSTTTNISVPLPLQTLLEKRKESGDEKDYKKEDDSLVDYIEDYIKYEGEILEYCTSSLKRITGNLANVKSLSDSFALYAEALASFSKKLVKIGENMGYIYNIPPNDQYPRYEAENLLAVHDLDLTKAVVNENNEIILYGEGDNKRKEDMEEENDNDKDNDLRISENSVALPLSDQEEGTGSFNDDDENSGSWRKDKDNVFVTNDTSSSSSSDNKSNNNKNKKEQKEDEKLPEIEKSLPPSSSKEPQQNHHHVILYSNPNPYNFNYDKSLHRYLIRDGDQLRQGWLSRVAFVLIRARSMVSTSSRIKDSCCMNLNITHEEIEDVRDSLLEKIEITKRDYFEKKTDYLKLQTKLNSTEKLLKDLKEKIATLEKIASSGSGSGSGENLAGPGSTTTISGESSLRKKQDKEKEALQGKLLLAEEEQRLQMEALLQARKAYVLQFNFLHNLGREVASTEKEQNEFRIERMQLSFMEYYQGAFYGIKNAIDTMTSIQEVAEKINVLKDFVGFVELRSTNNHNNNAIISSNVNSKDDEGFDSNGSVHEWKGQDRDSPVSDADLYSDWYITLLILARKDFRYGDVIKKKFKVATENISAATCSDEESTRSQKRRLAPSSKRQRQKKDIPTELYAELGFSDEESDDNSSTTNSTSRSNLSELDTNTNTLKGEGVSANSLLTLADELESTSTTPTAPTTTSTTTLTLDKKNSNPVSQIDTNSTFDTTPLTALPLHPPVNQVMCQSSPSTLLSSSLDIDTGRGEDINLDADTLAELGHLNLPVTEKIFASYSCAHFPKGGMLIHGRLFLTTSYFCFTGWGRRGFALLYSQVLKIERTNTMGYIPNSLEFTFPNGEIYYFTSFLFREKCLKKLEELHPPFHEIIYDKKPSSNMLATEMVENHHDTGYEIEDQIEKDGEGFPLSPKEEEKAKENEKEMVKSNVTTKGLAKWMGGMFYGENTTTTTQQKEEEDLRSFHMKKVKENFAQIEEDEDEKDFNVSSESEQNDSGDSELSDRLEHRRRSTLSSFSYSQHSRSLSSSRHGRKKSFVPLDPFFEANIFNPTGKRSKNSKVILIYDGNVAYKPKDIFTALFGGSKGIEEYVKNGNNEKGKRNKQQQKEKRKKQEEEEVEEEEEEGDITTNIASNTTVDPIASNIPKQKKYLDVYERFLRERGDTEISIGEWRQEESLDELSKEYFDLVREVNFVRHRNKGSSISVGPAKVKTQEIQRYRINPNDDSIILTTTSNFEGVPQSKFFAVCTRWFLSPVNNDNERSSTRIQIAFDVYFRTSLVLASIIRSNSEPETKAGTDALLDFGLEKVGPSLHLDISTSTSTKSNESSGEKSKKVHQTSKRKSRRNINSEGNGKGKAKRNKALNRSNSKHRLSSEIIEEKEENSQNDGGISTAMETLQSLRKMFTSIFTFRDMKPLSILTSFVQIFLLIIVIQLKVKVDKLESQLSELKTSPNLSELSCNIE